MCPKKGSSVRMMKNLIRHHFEPQKSYILRKGQNGPKLLNFKTQKNVKSLKY
jgi:hypothetical protein